MSFITMAETDEFNSLEKPRVYGTALSERVCPAIAAPVSFPGGWEKLHLKKTRSRSKEGNFRLSYWLIFFNDKIPLLFSLFFVLS